MSGMWNRTLIYLGLREEPEEGYDELPERFRPEDDPHAAHAPSRAATTQHDEHRGGSGRSSVRGDVEVRSGEATVRPLRPADVTVDAPSTSGPRAAIVELARFDDVEAVGARYRTGQPVVLDAGAADRATARRILDFVSGVTYALGGRLTRIGGAAYLLLPDGVELPADERRRLGDLGYRLSTGSEG